MRTLWTGHKGRLGVTKLWKNTREKLSAGHKKPSKTPKYRFWRNKLRKVAAVIRTKFMGIRTIFFCPYPRECLNGRQKSRFEAPFFFFSSKVTFGLGAGKDKKLSLVVCARSFLPACFEIQSESFIFAVICLKRVKTPTRINQTLISNLIQIFYVVN